MPLFKGSLVDSGINLTKFWLTVTRPEQMKRFEDRRSDPLKHWKLSPIDEASIDKWDDYTDAREDMFRHTDTDHAPWTVIKTDDKRRARIAAIQVFLRDLDYPQKDADVVGAPDPLIVGQAG